MKKSFIKKLNVASLQVGRITGHLRVCEFVCWNILIFLFIYCTVFASYFFLLKLIKVESPSGNFSILNVVKY